MRLDVELSSPAPRTSYTGRTYRHIAEQWDDPLSGEGACINGGRFNPPDSFPVLYLCTTRACAVAELRLRGERLVFGIEGLLPRILYRYEEALEQVLDLTSDETLEHLGVTVGQVVGPELTIPRQIGESAPCQRGARNSGSFRNWHR
ncbi:MAG: RES domain-containing protein [Acidimicrobiia bacterium]